MSANNLVYRNAVLVLMFLCVGWDVPHVTHWADEVDKTTGRQGPDLSPRVVGAEGQAVFSRDGTLLIAGGGLWHVPTNRLIRTVTWGYTVQFSPTESLLLSSWHGGGPEIGWEPPSYAVTDLKTGEKIFEYMAQIQGPEFDQTINAIFVPEHERFVLIRDPEYDPGTNGLQERTRLRMFDITTGEEVNASDKAWGFLDVLPDGTRVRIADDSSGWRGWFNTAEGGVAHKVPLPDCDGAPGMISADGNLALCDVASNNGQSHLLTLLSLEDHRKITSVRFPHPVVSADFTPTGELLVVGSGNEQATLVLIDTHTGQKLCRQEIDGVLRVSAVSAAAGLVLLSTKDTGYTKPALVDVRSGKMGPVLSSLTETISSVTDLSTANRVFVGFEDYGSMWDLIKGREQFRICTSETKLIPEASPHIVLPGIFSALVPSQDGREVITRSWLDDAYVVSFNPFKATLAPKWYSGMVALSPDSRLVLTDTYSCEAVLADRATGREHARLRDNGACFDNWAHFEKGVFSNDSRFLATLSGVGNLYLWNVDTGVRLRHLETNAKPIAGFGFSPDNKQLIVVSSEGFVEHLDLVTGRGLNEYYVEPESGITMAALSKDALRMVTGHVDGSVSIWNFEQQRLLMRLYTFGDGTWLAVDAEGRYDSNQPGNIPGLSWIMADDRFVPLPIEVFMREYFQPQLVRRVLEGEKFPPVPEISSLNRAQPDLKIIKVDVHDLRMDVTVRIRHGRQRVGDRIETTDAYDLRLFRDGQLVGWWPPNALAVSTASIDSWRKATRLTLSEKGVADVVLEDIRLLDRPCELTAYAFNEDRVKSPTACKKIEATRSHTLPRAYIVAIGVDSYDDPTWDLSYAVDDAEAFRRILRNSLSRTGMYAQVFDMSLVSRRGSTPETRTSIKPTIRAVFDVLAGKASPSIGVPETERIHGVAPGDLLIITYSGHGYVDGDGVYYMFPADIGPGIGDRINQRLLKRCISSNELSTWLAPVDCDIMMIIDACHSAAAVEGNDFRPAPLGSRGLGQLAYDKRMIVIAGSQADDVAIESETIRHGLLTYALVEDGLRAGLADFEPANAQITVSEWAEYAVQRVPELSALVAKNDPSSEHLNLQKGFSVAVPEPGSMRGKVQQPAIFNFSNRETDHVIFRKAPCRK